MTDTLPEDDAEEAHDSESSQGIWPPDALSILEALLTAAGGVDHPVLLDLVPQVEIGQPALAQRLNDARELVLLVAETIALDRDDAAWTRLRGALDVMKSAEFDAPRRRVRLMLAIEEARLNYPRETDEGPIVQCPRCWGWTSVTPCSRCACEVEIPPDEVYVANQRARALDAFYGELLKIASEFASVERAAIVKAIENDQTIPSTASDLAASVGAFGDRYDGSAPPRNVRQRYTNNWGNTKTKPGRTKEPDGRGSL